MGTYRLDEIIYRKDNNYNSYIFVDTTLFSDTAFRVIKTKEHDFLNGVKVTHNGKVKIIYDLSQYSPLAEVVGKLTSPNFLCIIKEVLRIVLDTSSNGFLSIEDIRIDINEIYINKEYKPVLVYLPLNTVNRANLIDTESEVRKLIINIISENRNLNNAKIMALYHDAGSLISLQQMYENLIINIEKQDEVSDDQVSSLTQSQTRTQDSVSSVNTKRKLTSIFFKDKKSSKNIITARKPIVLNGVNDMKISLIINKDEYTIGKKVDLVDGVIDVPSVSRIHCKVVWVDNSYYITDLGSLNGTCVNGKQINPGQLHAIEIGDVISIAKNNMIVSDFNS